jgi:hypothetical protein
MSAANRQSTTESTIESTTKASRQRLNQNNSTHSSPFAALIYYYSQYSFITIRSESTIESENSLSTGVVRVKDATTAVNNRVTRV